ncbi:hypothetical protein T492DRAFT_1073919 [Pavlovales sp. CCMP2436]|nr:hypothetical protein T492DRAFT_1073919 [Pavlovales sp. CCMP2436]|mmetsp:Transcript_12710/g.32203  ORF Transcript_12710/g.32203 Transcript_12710/m.32203 type:complete len:171 (+) Transcript_12710:215-727(+)
MDGPKIPCVHRIADGVFRGAYIGVVWGFYFAQEHLQECPAVANRALRRPVAVARVGRFVGSHVAGFSMFLGGYNALQCTLERVFGADSGVTPLASGATLGALASCILPTRPTGSGIALGAAATAATCFVVSRVLLPPPSRTWHPANVRLPEFQEFEFETEALAASEIYRQ